MGELRHSKSRITNRKKRTNKRRRFKKPLNLDREFSLMRPPNPILNMTLEEYVKSRS